MSTAEERFDALYAGLEDVRVKNRAVNLYEYPLDSDQACTPLIVIGEVNHSGLINSSDRQSDYTKTSFKITVAFCTERDTTVIQKADKKEMLAVINQIQEKTYCSYIEPPKLFASVIDKENVYCAQLEGEI